PRDHVLVDHQRQDLARAQHPQRVPNRAGIRKFAQAGAPSLLEPETVEGIFGEALGDGGQGQPAAREEGAEQLEIAEVRGGDDRPVAAGAMLLEAPVVLRVELDQLVRPLGGEIGRPQELDEEHSQVAVEVAEDGFAFGLALLREGLPEVVAGHAPTNSDVADEVADPPAHPEEDGQRCQGGGEGKGPSAREQGRRDQRGEDDPAPHHHAALLRGARRSSQDSIRSFPSTTSTSTRATRTRGSPESSDGRRTASFSVQRTCVAPRRERRAKISSSSRLENRWWSGKSASSTISAPSARAARRTEAG